MVTFFLGCTKLVQRYSPSILQISKKIFLYSIGKEIQQLLYETDFSFWSRGGAIGRSKLTSRLNTIFYQKNVSIITFKISWISTKFFLYVIQEAILHWYLRIRLIFPRGGGVLFVKMLFLGIYLTAKRRHQVAKFKNLSHTKDATFLPLSDTKGIFWISRIGCRTSAPQVCGKLKKN